MFFYLFFYYWRTSSENGTDHSGKQIKKTITRCFYSRLPLGRDSEGGIEGVGG